MALGTPEQPGHVRAVGKGITPSTYFHLARHGSKKHIRQLEILLEEEREKKKEEEEQRKNVEREVQILKEQFKRFVEERTRTQSSERIASNKSDNLEGIKTNKKVL